MSGWGSYQMPLSVLSTHLSPWSGGLGTFGFLNHTIILMETGSAPFLFVPPMFTSHPQVSHSPILFSAICDSDAPLNPISISSYFPSLVMCYYTLWLHMLTTRETGAAPVSRYSSQDQVFHERGLLESTLMLSGWMCTDHVERSGQESKRKVPIHIVGRLFRCQVRGPWRDEIAGRPRWGWRGEYRMQLLERCSLLDNVTTCHKGHGWNQVKMWELHYSSRLFTLNLLSVRAGICICAQNLSPFCFLAKPLLLFISLPSL